MAEEDNQAIERAELQAQIVQLPIENPLSLNEFLNPDEEAILDEDEDIFIAIVEYYTIDRLDKGLESSDEEEVKEIEIVEALRCVEQLRLWKLQKGNSQDLQALDRLEREIVQYKSSIATQTTIYRFFLDQYLDIRIPPQILTKSCSRTYSYMEVRLQGRTQR